MCLTIEHLHGRGHGAVTSWITGWPLTQIRTGLMSWARACPVQQRHLARENVLRTLRADHAPGADTPQNVAKQVSELAGRLRTLHRPASSCTLPAPTTAWLDCRTEQSFDLYWERRLVHLTPRHESSEDPEHTHTQRLRARAKLAKDSYRNLVIGMPRSEPEHESV